MSLCGIMTSILFRSIINNKFCKGTEFCHFATNLNCVILISLQYDFVKQGWIKSISQGGHKGLRMRAKKKLPPPTINWTKSSKFQFLICSKMYVSKLQNNSLSKYLIKIYTTFVRRMCIAFFRALSPPPRGRLVCMRGEARADLVYLNFRSGPTFPDPVCTVSPGHRVNKTDTQKDSVRH